MNTPETTVDLPALPPMGAQLLRTALPRRRARGEGLPQATLRVQGVRPDAAALARYRAVCGFDADGFLPITYPQVLATPLHLALMGRPDFPYPVMGLVHVRNHIRQQRRLPEGAALGVSVHFEARREVAAGVELDLRTRVECEGAPAWEALTTMLRRSLQRGGGKTERKPSPEAGADAFAQSRPAAWRVPADTGRRYGRASGDYNPIHLTALTARPFGFPRAIAHGMWTLARCVAELGEAAQADALTLDVGFRRPLLLPSEVTFQTRREGAAVHFRVSSSEGKPHLQGSLT
ncbi:acyl dehydratase [Aggregicoccus sp. 17bor-14]|uniref:MaoC family dehydratase n=1 Tax=Myxococcaceae TaxID=31 RepID=UPI00129D1200|nr:MULTISPECIES: MaoC/PaaZ C-terminal domain-containing protein [Myxococcaceae]MBF5043507.1 acyl dehydratase [Simulacricoccus sp. 17bor-14]MRI89264.1 acyl dehydratase [Aggregicoccus sp. 17bor-14]